MHELAIMESIVDAVIERVGDTKVLRVLLEIGKLTCLAHRLVARNGFRVLTHSRVPTNDGGISFGQAAAAA